MGNSLELLIEEHPIYKIDYGDLLQRLWRQAHSMQLFLRMLHKPPTEEASCDLRQVMLRLAPVFEALSHQRGLPTNFHLPLHPLPIALHESEAGHLLCHMVLPLLEETDLPIKISWSATRHRLHTMLTVLVQGDVSRRPDTSAWMQRACNNMTERRKLKISVHAGNEFWAIHCQLPPQP